MLKYILSTERIIISEALEIRKKVFIEEQGFAEDIDDIDRRALHLVAFDDDKPVATGRLYDGSTPDEKHIGRLAVLKGYRSRGIARGIIQFLENEAKGQNGKMICLSAQQRLCAYYQRLGYSSVGEPYLDEFCPHLKMVKKL